MKTRFAVLLAAASLFSTAAFAHGHHADCGISSDYDLSMNSDALVFTSKSAVPARVELRHGELLIDGRAQPLSAADRQRLADYEQSLRRLAPEVLAIAGEAVEIAFDAVERVARAFAADPHDAERTIAKLERAHNEARRHIEDSIASAAFSEAEFKRLMENTVQHVVPELAGDIAAAAVKAALSGDASAAELEARANRLEREIEREVEGRAEKLEARVDALCPRLGELDRIENSLDLRLADGRALDLYRPRH